MKREERDLCRLPTSFLSRMPSRFLNNQWRFCHMWHNLENRFEFERKRERLFNLSARSNFKWTNQSWRWNDLGCCRGPHYKSLREAEEANFKANFSFFTSLSTGKAHVFGSWSEIYWALWNCWFYCDSGLFFFEEKAICGVTSGQRWMEWFLC